MSATDPRLLVSRQDLDFLLFDWLEVDRLPDRPRFDGHSRETFDAFLDVSATMAAEAFANHNRANDLNEPTWDGHEVTVIPEVRAAWEVFSASGLLAAAMDAGVGGLQLPHTVMRACFAWFQAANLATSAYPMLTMANANLLLTYGTPDQVDRYVRPMLEGRFSGTMCLSEPHAGSSLADVETRAVRQPDGTFRLTGTKMWISGGDHELTENIVHLVLARSLDTVRGVHGLSLFVVPKHLVADDGSLGARNDVVLAGLNHKMGYRGTTNAVLGLGEGAHLPGGEAGAVGHLVGSEGAGLSAMFHMMNEARIAVGAGAVATGYTGYLRAVDYARSRPQGRPLGDRDPARPAIAIIGHPDVRRMLMASKTYVEGGMALVLYAARLVDEQHTAPDDADRQRAGDLLDVLTPIVKSWPSQWCLTANDHAIQVHGGYGYTRDYLVEQLYRDNRLNAIHEGTHGIQALDLLGRKVVMSDGRGFALLIEAIRASAAGAPRDLRDLAGVLDRAAGALERTTGLLWADGDAERALANASTYLEVAGHVVVAWMWLEQAIATRGRSDPFHDGKRAAARYFFNHELPRIWSQLDLLNSLDMTLLGIDEAWF